MRELWERWWPTVLGLVLLVVAGFFLWPKADRGQADRPQVTGEPLASAPEPAPAQVPPADTRGADLDRQRELDEARRRIALAEAADERNDEPEPTARRDSVEGAPDEPVRSVTLTQNSPEVQRALRSVEVELYETHWCQYCRKTRAFLDQSGISYRAYDVEADETAKLRKDRLAPGRGVPVTVIDGEPLYGFSEAALNAAFQTAISRRLARR
jgi:glutaredoxin